MDPFTVHQPRWSITHKSTYSVFIKVISWPRGPFTAIDPDDQLTNRSTASSTAHIGRSAFSATSKLHAPWWAKLVAAIADVTIFEGKGGVSSTVYTLSKLCYKISAVKSTSVTLPFVDFSFVHLYTLRSCPKWYQGMATCKPCLLCSFQVSAFKAEEDNAFSWTQGFLRLLVLGCFFVPRVEY